MTIHIQYIALSKLVPSKANVRRTGRTERIDELAASIAAHGLLQNLTVQATAKQRFEVIAGGRRLAALKLLVQRKEWAKDAPIPCQIVEGGNVTEISLAENAMQCPMHPADQFEAFAALHGQHMSIEDIAARFGVAPKIVTQRLKLGAVSAELMAVYRAGEMNLEQLSAFAITDDHVLQERVWQELGYDRRRPAILRALNQGQVATDDRRVLYVGMEAYVAAGGPVVSDLFDEDGGGFLSDPALLNRLADEKLALEAESVSAEGWQWVTVEPEFDYGLAARMRRIYPEQRQLTEAEQDKIEELSARYDTLSEEAGDQATDAIERALSAIDSEIEAIRGDEIYAPEDKAVAGAIVSLGRDGEPRIERGYVRQEDERRHESTADAKPTDGGSPASKDQLSAALIAELTAHRTAALGNELAQQPGLALIASVHALVTKLFYALCNDSSCLKLDVRRARLTGHAKEIGESRAMTEIDARHQSWQRRMPEEPTDLWAFVAALTEAERLALLAHCVSLTVDAVHAPKSFGFADVRQNADTMAASLGLDMAAYWQPTMAGYFGRVSKARILQAVREAVSPEAAQAIEGLKKPAMAERAEKLLAGRGWLPTVLRIAA